MQSKRWLLNWLIFVATTPLKIVVADMALVTQEGWTISAQGFAPLTIEITIRTFAQCFDSQ